MPSCLLLSGHVAQGVGPVVDFKYEKAKGTRNGPGTLSALLVVLPRSLENIPAPPGVFSLQLHFYCAGRTNCGDRHSEGHRSSS